MIYWNVQLWKWYFFHNNMGLATEQERDQAFNIMTMAAGEDIRLFARFLMYSANTRNKDRELEYKTMCHFLGLMHPDFAIANIELFVSMGKKSDALFFMPSMPEKISRWINYKAKYDDEYNKMVTAEPETVGEVLASFKIDRRVRYRPKATKNYKWEYFFLKLAGDPIFNGILSSNTAVILPEDKDEAVLGLQD